MTRAAPEFVLWQVRVSLNDQQISGSPFTATVMPGRTIAVRCTAVGRGLTRAYAGSVHHTCAFPCDAASYRQAGVSVLKQINMH